MIIAMAMHTAAGRMTMTEPDTLYRLLSWFSPSYPIGAYTYSHGLEQAVERGLMTSATDTRAMLRDIVEYGAGFSDLVFLASAYRAVEDEDNAVLTHVAELAAAFVATRELALESQAQGDAFLQITQRSWPTPALNRLESAWDGPYAYAVVVGCTAAGHGVPLRETALAYLHAFTANLVSAAVRLVPLGQTDGQRITADLAPDVHATVERALACEIDAVGTAALMTDICSMNHETQHTRLFRS